MLGKRPIYTNVHNIDGRLVVAENIQEAIGLYEEVYPNETIKKVELVKGDWDDHFGLAICGVRPSAEEGQELPIEVLLVNRIDTEIEKINEHDLDGQVGLNKGVIRGLTLAKWVIEEEFKKREN